MIAKSLLTHLKFKMLDPITTSCSKISIVYSPDINALVSISTEYPEKKSDNGSYGLKEWSDNNLSPKEILKFENAKSIKVRFSGKYSYDFDMNQTQLKAFIGIIQKYKQLNET